MKTILLLTDFSENALVAAQQTALMVPDWHTQRIIVYHSYTSVATINNEAIVVVDEEGRKAKEQELQEWTKEISPFFPPSVQVEHKLEDIALEFGVNELCESENIDLVAMGITGQTGLAKVLIGSNATRLMDVCIRPILIVPVDAKLAIPSHILLTTDLRDVDRKLAFFDIEQVVKAFAAKLYVLNVAKRESSAAELAEEMDHLHQLLDKYDPQYDFISSDDIAKGIHDYAEAKHIDLILAFHKKQGILASLFKTSISKKLAWNATASLLVIPLEH